MDEFTYGYDDSLLDDERNAGRDHRKDNRLGRRVPGMAFGRPRTRPTPGGSGGDGGSRQVVIYREPPMQAQARTGLFSNLTTDEIVELAAQVFASIQPLPAGPTASGDLRIDVENLITYQGALALHAKRDEQLRTIGSLLSKLISK
jgi:hypothetical protein